MIRLKFVCLIALLGLVLCYPLSASRSQSGSGQDARLPTGPRLLVIRDAKGKVLQRSRYVFLTGRHIGVSLADFRKLGLSTEANGLREVGIGEGETDAWISLTLDKNRVFLPSAPTEKSAYDYYGYPVARRIGGHIYVSVSVMQEEFSDWFSVRMNGKTHVLTLRRS